MVEIGKFGHYFEIWYGLVWSVMVGYVMNVGRGYVMNVGRGYVIDNSESGSHEGRYRTARAAKNSISGFYA